LKNRHKIVGSTVQAEASSSSWNSQVVRKECEICKKQITSDLEVHHIKERASATNGILDDGTSMNNTTNLIVICKKCHDDTHNGIIEIGDVKQTSDGPEREIIIKDVKLIQKKSKWTDEQLETIVDTLRKYSTLSLKSIRAHLSSKHEIQISEVVLGKMRKDI
jgi:hypothetical protein